MNIATCRHEYVAMARVWDVWLAKWEFGPYCPKCNSVKIAWSVDEAVE